MAENSINVFEEDDLTGLLGLWLAPVIPRSLDQRIVRSFRWIRHDHIGIASPRTKPATLEVSMKRCNACDEEFADKTQPEFKVTMISSVGLGRRLATEVSFAIEQLQRAWSDLRHSCPARTTSPAIDLKLAERVLGDPRLYASAVHALRPSTHVAHNPAPAGASERALTEADRALSSRQR